MFVHVSIDYNKIASIYDFAASNDGRLLIDTAPAASELEACSRPRVMLLFDISSTAAGDDSSGLCTKFPAGDATLSLSDRLCLGLNV
jgi:hypothetical protein